MVALFTTAKKQLRAHDLAPAFGNFPNKKEESKMKRILIPMLVGFVLGMALASAAKAETVWTRACGTHAGIYFCTDYRAAVPLPRARPVIPCDTDSDCMEKNGGNGDPAAVMGPCDTDPDDYCDSYHAPVNPNCFDPQEDETFGENGILCRDGEDY